jgi:spore coat polysaccharide biosynthesis predicted glycosyltransferase SpsG
MSVYEIAALGTPGIILGQNTREERRMRQFARSGTVEYLGLGTEVDEQTLLGAVESLLRDAERRRDMSRRGRQLVDGLGATRAAELVLGATERPKSAPHNHVDDHSREDVEE